MDIDLFDELQEEMPVFKQDILDGIPYKGLMKAKDDVDRLIECAADSFPDEFEYAGSSVCSPQKAYRVMSGALTKSDRGSASIDLAPSDVYLTEYNFLCNGRPLYPRYFYLPYVRKGGLITIAGKQFSISPVLMDPCFSIGEDYVFIRVNRAPITFKRVIGGVMLDGRTISKHIVCSALHHKGGRNDRKRESDTIHVGRVWATMPHYLFCRFGVAETFRKFANTEVILTTEAELQETPLDTTKYALISSRKSPPSALKTRVNYALIASPVVMAIPRERLNNLTLGLAAGFFYTVDHFPEITDTKDLMSEFRWKVWLGYILWGDHLAQQKLVENVTSHLSSLDDYIDLEARNTLREEENLDIENIYELFIYMLVEMDHLISNKETSIGSMYGKRLVSAPYVLRDIYESVFRCLFEITNNKKRKHNADSYNKILGKFFSPARIFDLRKTSMKTYISIVSTPGDNMFFKATSRLVMQAHTAAGSAVQNLNVNDPMCHLHPSIAEAGNYLILPKNSPLGRNTINPTVELDDKNTILQKPYMEAVIDHIDEAIHRY